MSALDESQQGLYSQGESGYTLNVEGVPEQDVSGLKQKIDKLLGEKKNAQQLAQEAQEMAKAEAAEKLKKANDYEQLYNSSEEERKKSTQELNDLQNKITMQQINGQAQELAQALTKDTARAKLLTEQIQSRLSLVDGEVRVTDNNGNLTVSTLQELTNSIKSDYPFLVDGSQAAGGGAIGSSSGAGDSKTVSRAEFDALDQFARSKFFKDGGKII